MKTKNHKEATKQFVEKVNEIRRSRQAGPLAWNTAVKFLMARKFDVDRAVVLYEQHELTRQREGLVNLNPAADPLRTELSTGKFTILPCRDSSGAALAVFHARLHDPRHTSHQTTLQGVVYQLDAALESIETQRCGLIFIYDMTESVYNNFDYNLSQKILTLLKGGYPARLKKVLIVTAPLWFRAPFRVLRLFVREKLRDRVYTVTVPELANHIPLQCLPQRLGGSLEVNHEAWLIRCYEAMTHRHSHDLHELHEVCLPPTQGGEGQEDRGGSPPAVNGIHHKDMDSANHNHHNDTLKALVDGEDNLVFSDDEDCDVSGKTTLSEEEEEEELGEKLGGEDGEQVEGGEEEGAEDEGGEADDDAGAQLQQLLQEVARNKALCSSEEHFTARTNNLDDISGHCSPPLPPSSGSSGFSDDDSLHYDDGRGLLLQEFVMYLKETGRAGLCFEYSQIKSRPPEGTFDQSRKRWNQFKNRYTDVLCFDHSRVELRSEDEEGHSTYINANYVDGYKQKKAFISSQGPLPCTFGDFWRMVWEQCVCVVVMTTKTNERGRIKCGQYWPLEQGTSVTHSHFSITNTSVTREPAYVVTQLDILDSRTGESRVVEHLQFTSWPDYGVPDSALAMLDFLSCVRESQAKLTATRKGWTGHSLGPPILVHCSAGIGRTGTFCTLDICIRRLEDVGTIDVKGTVQKIRSQRAYSIQMPDQYVFCHLALLEYALSHSKLTHVDLTGFEDEASESD